jgi:uncharacterized membrane protein
MEGKLKKHQTNECLICKKHFSSNEVTPVETIRDSLLKAIIKMHPALKLDVGFICKNDLNKTRKEYFKQLIIEERGDLTEVEASVIKALHEHEVVSKLVDSDDTHTLTFGQKLSDKIAEFGGSWPFIISFGIMLTIWIMWNNHSMEKFDPYPYILLNLILSCLASLQAPIIMMSQNRQQARDRIKQYQDFKVNLKSEVEIRMLNEKIDKLISTQWQRLLEIQEMQMDFMEELTSKKKH